MLFLSNNIVLLSEIPLNKFEKRGLNFKTIEGRKDITGDMSYCSRISARYKTNSKRIREKEKIRNQHKERKKESNKKTLYKFTGIYSFQRRETN